MPLACGIDFGTSNSAVGRSDSAGTRLLPLQDGARSVPTALFYSFEDDTTSFGHDAMQRYLSGEHGRLLRSIKSLLGTALFEEATQIKRRRIAFSEIIADFLAYLRARATEDLGCAPDHVVMGRPAFFIDDDAAADARAQDQLEAAARASGFAAVEFQFEPIAAALDYERSVGREEIALVADIGGGTSDFSLVRVSPQRATRSDRRDDILAYDGVHIGGTDFDRLLSMSTLMPFLGLRSKLKVAGMEAPSWYFSDLATWHRVNALYEPRVMTELRGVHRDSAEPEKIERLMRVVERRLGHDLLGRAEQAKIDLSAAEKARIALADVAPGLILAFARGRFERAIAASLARIEIRVRECLRRAGVRAEAVSTVFLTGGSSGIPSVRSAIGRVVPEAGMVVGDAFGSVATGLALDARRRFER